jgi:hypothetical protein
MAAALAAALAGPAMAQTPTPAAPLTAEAAALNELRATILLLIEALVEQGLLTRAKADELLRRARSAGDAAHAGTTAPVTGWGAPKPVVRVPYLSESTREKIKQEVRNDVLATARDEDGPRWLPTWLKSDASKATCASGLRRKCCPGQHLLKPAR